MTKKTIASPFTQKFLDQILEILTQEKKRLAKEILTLTGKNEGNFPEYGDEDDDNAREIADFTANKPVEIALENELRDVNKSMKRIAEGGYGICKYCEKVIDEKRLLARPTSSSCVSCKKTVSQEA